MRAKRKRKRRRETVSVYKAGPDLRVYWHRKSRMCELIRVRVLLFMFIRKWRHRPPPLPLCSRRWRRWRSRARWRRWTWTATHPAGRVRRPPTWGRGRWPRSWRASARRCSRRWVRSPWRPPSSWGSEKVTNLTVRYWSTIWIPTKSTWNCYSSCPVLQILSSDPCLQVATAFQGTLQILFSTGGCKVAERIFVSARV